jgi:phosphatidate cytidylyltransferase
MTPAKGQWDDLLTRMASGGAVAAVGLGLMWLGGIWFQGLCAVVAGVMVWELARMLGADRAALPLGAVSGGAIFAAGFLPPSVVLPLILLPALAGLPRLGSHRAVWAAFTFAILLAAFGLMVLREDYGFKWVAWLVCIVIASDVFGYFAGRLIGGPKFWPKVSPKKTWAGTVAGWVGAAAVGLAFMTDDRGGTRDHRRQHRGGDGGAAGRHRGKRAQAKERDQGQLEPHPRAWRALRPVRRDAGGVGVPADRGAAHRFPAGPRPVTRTISIFGSTGSIGCSTIDLVAREPERYRVVALTGGRNVAKLAEQAKALKAELAVTAHPECYDALKEALAGTGIEAAAGEAPSWRPPRGPRTGRCRPSWGRRGSRPGSRRFSRDGRWRSPTRRAS